MNAAPAVDPFTRLTALGYGERLIPIVPPGAEISPRSNIWTRLQAGDDSRGKVPGARGADGLWTGIRDWETRETDARDLARWAAMGASTGIRTGRGLAAIDADALDVDIARRIKVEIDAMRPGLPLRVGRYPKAIYLVRVEEDEQPCPYMRVAFGEWVLAPNGRRRNQRDRIEILTLGKQFVAHGRHPSGVDYEWRIPLAPFNELPVVTRQELRDLLERCRAFLPSSEPISVDRTAGAAPAAETLRAPADAVRAALSHIKNEGERFAEREDYRDIGYAIKAAVEDESAALAMWLEWCASWKDGVNDPEIAATDWERMRPPFRRGASWLFELAEEMSGGAYNRHSRWHEQPDLSPASAEPVDDLDTFLNRDLDDEPPPQRWYVRNWIPHGQTTILSGDGGTGKSLIALQMVIAGNLGREWLGESVAPGPALFLTAEDDREEINRRQAAILRGYGATRGDLSDALHSVTLHGKDAVIATADGKNPLLLRPTRLMQRLHKALERIKPAIVVLDTQADLFGGRENERAHARQFIGYLQRIAREHDCAVLLLAHPSMSGMASGSGASGVTAWSNSVRSRLYLSRQVDKDGDEHDADFRVLSVKKANRGRVGLSLGLRYREGVFELSEKTTSAVDMREDDATFLKILRRGNDNQDWVTLARNTNRYAPKAMAAADATGRKIGITRLTDAMNRLLDSGAIRQEKFGAPSRPNYRLIEDESRSEASFDKLSSSSGDFWD